MAVKALRSATRVLSVLEAVASLQPVGLAAVARHLDEDKSAVQRALATLAEDGWIRPAPGEACAGSSPPGCSSWPPTPPCARTFGSGRGPCSK